MIGINIYVIQKTKIVQSKTVYLSFILQTITIRKLKIQYNVK